MRYKIILYLAIILLSSIAFASDNVPPPIPSEFWGTITIEGSPAPDGLSVEGFAGNANYAQPSTTLNGYYDVILAGGDSDLTFLNDSTCATHWANNDACIPCSTNPSSDDYCIEGPQNGAQVVIKINGKFAAPFLVWSTGAFEQNLVISQNATVNFSIKLVPGWNLISIPVLPVDNTIVSIMSGCNYNKLWEFQNDQSWKSTATGLNSINITKGYWVDRIGLAGNCTITVEGSTPTNTTIFVTSQWTLVGMPSSIAKSINGLINPSLYDKIWEYQQGGGWVSTATGLTQMTPGRGYWIDGTTGGSYNVTY